MNVHRTIREANISSDFEAVSGDCQSIALAIHDVFGGRLVAVTSNPGAKYVKHLAVEIDGTVYDGRGKVAKDQICREFVNGHLTHPVEDYLWAPDRSGIRARGSRNHRLVRERLEEKLD